MPFGDVQFFKIIQIVFYLRSFYHLVAHAHEDPLHFLQGNGVGMLVACIGLLCRKGHIDHFPLHLFLSGFSCQCGLRFLQPLLDESAYLVDHLAHLGSFLRGHILHAL